MSQGDGEDPGDLGGADGTCDQGGDRGLRRSRRDGGA